MLKLVLQFLILLSVNIGIDMRLFSPTGMFRQVFGTVAPGVESVKERQTGLMMKTIDSKQTSSKLQQGLRNRQSQFEEDLLSGNIYETAKNRLANSPVRKWMDSQDSIRRDQENKAADFNLKEELYGKKGSSNDKVVDWSHYNDDIPEEGYTRNSGGAPKAVQQSIIKKIIEVGRTLQATDEEIAYSLATARYESGFNPYAAAKKSSAYGLGQFIRKTGKFYNLNQENRDDVNMQAQALVEHTMDNFRTASNKNYSKAHVYALHHDGPSLNKDGLSKSREHIMPYIPKYLKIVEGYRPYDPAI
tara:strand:- start:870 stop:1778 length:909 start_codon:yes stop_codon:yes gene_type:complete